MEKETKNYYEVLEIPTDANQEEISSAYTRAKNAYSGDSLALYSLMSEDECKEVINLIEEAYSILGAAEKRREYDRVRGINQLANSARTSSSGKSISFYQESIAPKNERTSFQFEEKAPPAGGREYNSYMPSSSSSSSSSYTSRPENVSNDFNIHRKDINVSKITAHNRFSLNFSVNQQFEEEIENTSTFTGEMLRKIREYKNVNVERMAEMTRISKAYINHIERDEFDKLPAHVYTRGFVYQIAKVLKLNPDIVASSYVHHLKTLKNGK